MKDVRGIRFAAATGFWVAYWAFVFWAARPGHLDGHSHLVNGLIVIIGLAAAYLTYAAATRRITWAQRGDG